MFGPLLLTGVSAIFGGIWVCNRVNTDPNLEPKLLGLPMAPAVAGIGAIGALVLGGPMAWIGAGLFAGATIAGYQQRQLQTGLELRALQERAAPPPAQIAPPIDVAPMTPAAAGPPVPADGLIDRFMSFWR